MWRHPKIAKCRELVQHTKERETVEGAWDGWSISGDQQNHLPHAPFPSPGEAEGPDHKTPRLPKRLTNVTLTLSVLPTVEMLRKPQGALRTYFEI